MGFAKELQQLKSKKSTKVGVDKVFQHHYQMQHLIFEKKILQDLSKESKADNMGFRQHIGCWDVRVCSSC